MPTLNPARFLLRMGVLVGVIIANIYGSPTATSAASTWPTSVEYSTPASDNIQVPMLTVPSIIIRWQLGNNQGWAMTKAAHLAQSWERSRFQRLHRKVLPPRLCTPMSIHWCYSPETITSVLEKKHRQLQKKQQRSRSHLCSTCRWLNLLWGTMTFCPRNYPA